MKIRLARKVFLRHINGRPYPVGRARRAFARFIGWVAPVPVKHALPGLAWVDNLGRIRQPVGDGRDLWRYAMSTVVRWTKLPEGDKVSTIFIGCLGSEPWAPPPFETAMVPVQGKIRILSRHQSYRAAVDYHHIIVEVAKHRAPIQEGGVV